MERTVDLALLYDAAKITDLNSVPVTHAELILVSSSEQASVEDAININFVSVDWGTSCNLTFAQLFPETSSAVLHTTQARIALEFILFHGGSAYLPLRLVNTYLTEGKLFHLTSAPVIQRPVHAVYHKENRYSKYIEDMVRIITDVSTPMDQYMHEFELYRGDEAIN